MKVSSDSSGRRSLGGRSFHRQGPANPSQIINLRSVMFPHDNALVHRSRGHGVYVVFCLSGPVLKQDDEVAEVVAELSQTDAYNDMGNVLHLSSTTFHSFTRGQQQTVMVLFYVTCEDCLLFIVLFFIYFRSIFLHVYVRYIYCCQNAPRRPP